MGIQGLLPFLKKASREVNIRSFSNAAVAIDAYCWLHKGAFSCAERLGKGEKTDGYVRYCMKFVNMLLASGLKPILVFDGKNLPSKSATETKRRENREKNRKKAVQFLREGKAKEARECFQRSVDVTPEMALDVIRACRKLDVDCIVAPYEADAQLAYLSKCGIADIVITEDSDLLLFGCERIMFKMDLNGNGILVEQSQVYQCMGMRASNFTFEKFQYMCILSGCDYLPSLPGIGLVKACKFFSRVSDPDPFTVLPKLPSVLNMQNLQVTPEYRESFVKAVNTFHYQLVFCPLKKKLVPLNPYPPEVDPKEITYAGTYFPDEVAYHLALGNINIHSMERVDSFDPNTARNNTKQGKENKQLSIWDKDYKVVKRDIGSHKEAVPVKTTFGKEVVVDTSKILRQKETPVPSAQDNESASAFQVPETPPKMLQNAVSQHKRPRISPYSVVESKEEEIVSSYLPKSPPNKKRAVEKSTLEECKPDGSSENADKCEEQQDSYIASPPRVRNMFRITPASSQQKTIVKSRFFDSTPPPARQPAPASKSPSWLDEIEAQYAVQHCQPKGSVLDMMTTPTKQRDSLKKWERSKTVTSQNVFASFRWNGPSSSLHAKLGLRNSVAVESGFSLPALASDKQRCSDSVSSSESTQSQTNDSGCDLANLSHESQDDPFLSSSHESSEGDGMQKEGRDDDDLLCLTPSAKKDRVQYTCLMDLGGRNSATKNGLGAKLGKCRGTGLSKKKTARMKSAEVPAANQQTIKAMLEKFKFTRAATNHVLSIT